MSYVLHQRINIARITPLGTKDERAIIKMINNLFVHCLLCSIDFRSWKIQFDRFELVRKMENGLYGFVVDGQGKLNQVQKRRRFFVCCGQKKTRSDREKKMLFFRYIVKWRG